MTKSVLLVTSNGWGLGHLVRQLAIANQLPREVRCTILTLSQAASVAARPNLEYAPSYTQPWLAKGEWHGGYLRDRIVALAQEVEAEVIAFDGVVPYLGLRDAFTELPAERVWIRRGLWSQKASRAPLRSSSWFDLILEPSDVADAFDVGPTANRHDALKVGVITEANPNTAFGREAAARRLGLDPWRPTVLVNVGSSAIGDLGALEEVAVAHPEWQFVTTRDELGRSRSLSNVHVLAGIFPLHPYLRAIDLAVSSVGYNAAHEFIGMEVPTIWVPAPTTTDDQFARARAIESLGAGWAVTDRSAATTATMIEKALLSASSRSEKSMACHSVRSSWTNGAREAAELITQAPALPKRESGWQWLGLAARTSLERALGDTLRWKDRKWHDSVVLSRELNRELLSSELPFEHVLPNASEGYELRRRDIAERWLVRTPSE